MVCGMMGELTKLRAYGFQFCFQVVPVAEGSVRDDRMCNIPKFKAKNFILIKFLYNQQYKKTSIISCCNDQKFQPI